MYNNSPLFHNFPSGGTRLTITGNGFQQAATVKVAAADCPVLSVAHSQIVCETPAASAGSAVDVVVNSGGTELKALAAFTYAAASSPVVSAMEPSSVSVMGMFQC